MRSLWLLFVYMSFLGLSTSTPFVATLGYVWVDTFRPQEVAYVVLNQLPVALIMGAAAFTLYILADRRSPPRLSAEAVLHVILAIWVNLTMIWAQAPSAAWTKWDWAFKTLAFSVFVPYVIRSRVQIEAFAQTYVFALAANFLPFGIKTLISGGGYGVNLGLIAGNAGLGEGGMLSTACLMAVPLAVYLSRHSQLVPKLPLLPLVYWSTAGLAVVTALGTYERSALIGMIALGLYMWSRARNKVGFGLIVLFAGVLIAYTASQTWTARVSTIQAFENEGSAYTRILVWRWTLDFVATHPLGGGFMTNVISHIVFPAVDSEPQHEEFGRAFHSIYFEMLGEQGYPGLAMFLAITALTIIRLRRVAKKARAYPQLEWVRALSNALQSGIAVFMSAGAFVGIAFQPMYWYFIALSVSLNAYMWRIENQDAAPVTGWRATAHRATLSSSGWRNRPATAVNGRWRRD